MIDHDRSIFGKTNLESEIINVSIRSSVFSIFKIQNCLFWKISSTGDGGAIFFGNIVTTLLIYYCSFMNCTCTNSGGAIFSTSSYCNFSHNCFYLCMHKLYGSCFELPSIISSHIFYCSSNSCPSISNPSYHCSLLTRYGKHFYENINVSTSSNSMVSGIYNFQCTSSKIHYYISTNNIAGSSIGFGVFSYDGDHKYLIFLNNTCNQGIFHLYRTNTMVFESYFLNNKGKIRFDYENSNFVLSLKSCYFNIEIISENYLTISNLFTISNYLISYIFFSTYFCQNNNFFSSKIKFSKQNRLELFYIIYFICSN